MIFAFSAVFGTDFINFKHPYNANHKKNTKRTPGEFHKVNCVGRAVAATGAVIGARVAPLFATAGAAVAVTTASGGGLGGGLGTIRAGGIAAYAWCWWLSTPEAGAGIAAYAWRPTPGMGGGLGVRGGGAGMANTAASIGDGAATAGDGDGN